MRVEVCGSEPRHRWAPLSPCPTVQRICWRISFLGYLAAPESAEPLAWGGESSQGPQGMLEAEVCQAQSCRGRLLYLLFSCSENLFFFFFFISFLCSFI